MIRLTDEVKFMKGVGPQRAATLAKRGIATVEDLIAYLPFRYEDRSHFATIRDMKPGETYTLRVEVVEGQFLKYARRYGGLYHLVVKDATGRLHCRFFHSGYLEGKYKAGQQFVLYGKAD
jgi:ATP-dependent DNA helicase RecG